MARSLAKKQTGGTTKIRPVIGAKPAAKDTTKSTPKIEDLDAERMADSTFNKIFTKNTKPLPPEMVYKGKRKKGGSTGAFDRYSKKK